MADERSRLRELWSYNIIGTPPDPSFDEIVQLAADLCEAPFAAVSLAESDRLCFKAKVGLAVDALDREGAFCDTVVSSKAPLIIDNALEDPRFCASGLVCGAAHVRAYCGMPLVTPSAAIIGSLCVLDTKPREWRPVQREAVRVLAAQVVARLELRRANAELTHLWEDHRALETRALTGARDDQRRLAAELHDGLGQDLTGMSFLVKALRGQTKEATTRAELAKIEQLMRSAIESCRRLARGHLAFGFQHGSLRDSLQHYLAGISEMSRTRCVLHWPSTVALRDRTIAYNLYRIAQEAVTNAVRHSGGDEINVTVEEADGLIRVQIDDNGRGLAPDRGGGGGVGLETMRFRASAIGGSLLISPRDPSGVSVRCELPTPGKRITRHRHDVAGGGPAA
jgi:signal transduction histidine kinase